MLLLRKVSVTIKMSTFSFSMSRARRLQAFLLLELTFLREQTFKTAMVGRRVFVSLILLIGSDVSFLLVLQGACLSGSHICGGQSEP